MSSESMTVASTPCSSPRFNGHIAEGESRELVDSLLDNGEHVAIMDAIAMETEKEAEVAEMVCGWGYSLSFPKPPVVESKRGPRRRADKSQVQDIDTSRIIVRCINEDYDVNHHRAAWKANVEPGTYRYIANNGIYRSTKFASLGNDWVTAKRSRHYERGTPGPEVRQAQRSLRKDLDMHFKSRDHHQQQSQQQQEQQQQNHHQQQQHGQESQPPTVSHPQSQSVSTPGSTSKESSDQKLKPASRDRYKDPKLVKSASDLFIENFSSRMTAIEKEMSAPAHPSKGLEGPPKPGSSPRTAVNSINTAQGRRNTEGSATEAAKLIAQQIGDISKDVFMVKPVVRADQPLKPLERLTPQQKILERGGSESDKGSQRSNSNSNPESPLLSTSFMTAMNAFNQIHHQYHRDGQQSKSSPSTVRSPHKNHPPQHHHHHHHHHHRHQHHHHHSNQGSHVSSNGSDTDSLNSVRNALNLTNIDIEKMRMGNSSLNPFSLNDYNRFWETKTKVPALSVPVSKPPFGIQRRGMQGYKHAGPGSSTVQNVANSGLQIMSASESVKTASPEQATDSPPLLINRGFRDSKANSVSLPEISGKRLSVMSTTHRLL